MEIEADNSSYSYNLINHLFTHWALITTERLTLEAAEWW